MARFGCRGGSRLRLEIIEEKVRHDVWGCEIRMILDDNVNFNKKVGDLMRVLGKYFARNYQIFKNGSPVEVKI